MYKYLGRPCRNFNILAKTVMIDPLDGREKLVLSNFVAGGTGSLILIDTESHAYEVLPLPGDEGAWGLVNWFDQKLVVGTCPNHAYLHCLDLVTREWAPPLSDPDEKYFWDMTLGSDGYVYGGSWPGCSLLRYDPRTHELLNQGRVSENLDNHYSRPVYGGLPGTIFVAGGFSESFLKAYDMEKEEFHAIDAPGFTVREANSSFICLEKGTEQIWYDAVTFQRIPDLDPQYLSVKAITLPNGQDCSIIALANGRYAGVRGQDYFILEQLSDVPILQRIPSDPSPTRIFTLLVDAKNQVWGSSGFGQTIFRYDPVSDEAWNSATVCNAGGEVYGMVALGEQLYLSAYVGGDHIIYRPEQPWDQLNNRNPKMLQAASPDYIRPEGRSVLGPDGGIWTGWSAKYGQYGGALSRMDPDTEHVHIWREPLNNGQQVCGVAADNRYVYLKTNGGASGLPIRQAACGFGVWQPGVGLVHQVAFPEEEQMGHAIAVGDSYVFIQAGSSLHLFDPNTMQVAKRIATAEPCSWLLQAGEGTMLAFVGHEAIWFDERTTQVVRKEGLPGPVRAAARASNGDIYFAVGDVLYRFKSTNAIGRDISVDSIIAQETV
ncbi:hypothetical protein [Paenibacillus qinlingensis]|uniref:Uncharacterized protein n=1 Tax=Paenibacillus qinlingensis TaxID=1837343 RepID=A0ABU1NNY5_9BACL|nr:hypothetical protein [Paenibacillus qinlingensis]MDR6549177.1 hypothetical protein [Paenibacillus qinlingensis]